MSTPADTPHPASTPQGPAAPPQRPQDATGGGGESPAASGGAPVPHRGAESFGQLLTRAAAMFSDDEPAAPTPDGLREQIAAALTAWTAQAAPRGARLPEVVTANSLSRADAVLSVVQPILDERDRRIATLEHVARGNKRHVQVMHEELTDAQRRAERAEAAVQRVRAIHTHGPRTNTCNEDGAVWPCDTIRALDCTDTPKETR